MAIERRLPRLPSSRILMHPMPIDGIMRAAHVLRPRGKTQMRRSGTAAVEFAIVAPLIVLFVMGVIEFGRAMFLQQVAITTARAACRDGILGSASNSSVQNALNLQLQGIGLTGGTSTIRVSGQSDRDESTAAPGEPIEISVTIPYTANSWLPSPFYLGGKSLTGRVTMSKE